MCTIVGVKRKDSMELCETVGALAIALGIGSDRVSDDPVDYCLCNVDLASLGARPAVNDEGFPHPEYVIDCPEHKLPIIVVSSTADE